MNLSVIIASHNSWNFLQPCLNSIYDDCGRDVEVIVVDNASTDGTPELLRSYFPEAVLIENGENRGHCIAINQGIRRATRDHLMVLDADTVLTGYVGETLLAFMSEHPDACVVAPRMENGDGTLQPTARSFPRPIHGLFGRQSLLTRWLPGNRISRAYLGDVEDNVKAPYRVEFVSSACMVFTRKLVENIGLWDEGFLGYWADADWCKRAGTFGSVYCVPMVTVIHYEQNRRAVRKGVPRILLFHDGVNRFYRKHYTKGRFDPRAVAAAVLLYVRAGFLIVVDQFLPRAATPRIPETRTRRAPVGAGERNNDVL